MKEIGTITKILDNGRVEIEVSASGGCANCGLCKIGMNNKAHMTAKGMNGLSTGDMVMVETREKDIAMISFLLFILPVVLFLAGYMVYNYVLSVVLIIIYLICLWAYDRYSDIKGGHLPFVVNKIR